LALAQTVQAGIQPLELALSSGKNEPAISASTLYPFLKQRGLSEKQLLNWLRWYGMATCAAATAGAAKVAPWSRRATRNSEITEMLKRR